MVSRLATLRRFASPIKSFPAESEPTVLLLRPVPQGIGLFLACIRTSMHREKGSFYCSTSGVRSHIISLPIAGTKARISGFWPSAPL